MENVISSALKNIISRVLTDINDLKSQFPLIGKENDNFDVEIWFQDSISDRILDFKNLFELDNKATFNALFIQLTDLVSICAGCGKVSETQFIEISIYKHFSQYLYGSNFIQKNTPIFSRFLDNCMKLIQLFPKNKHLFDTFVDLSNSFILNGGILTISVKTNLTNFHEIFLYFSFFLNLRGAGDIAGDILITYFNKMLPETKVDFFNNFNIEFPKLFFGSKYIQQQMCSQSIYRAFKEIITFKGAKDKENVLTLALLLSICINSSDLNSEQVKFVLKICLDMKKWKKRSKELAVTGLTELIGNLIYNQNSIIKNEILNAKTQFETTYFSKKGEADLQGLIPENVLSRYFAYDAVLQRGEITPSQKYFIDNLNNDVNSRAFCYAVYIIFTKYSDRINSLNDEVILENFNEIKKSVEFKKENADELLNWFFAEFSNVKALEILSKTQKSHIAFLETLITFLGDYSLTSNYSYQMVKLLNVLFSQKALIASATILKDIIALLDPILQKMIIENKIVVTYAPNLVIGLTKFAIKSNQENNNKLVLLSMATYIGAALNLPLFDKVKVILGYHESFTLNNPETSDTAIETTIKIIRIFLAITEAATNGKTKSVYNYNVKANPNLCTIFNLVDYLFRNGLIVLGKRNFKEFESEPLESFFNAVFNLFNYGSGSMTPIIEKAKILEKACVPLLVHTATNMLSPEKFDSSVASKKLWAQTLKFMNAAVLNPELRTSAFNVFETFLIVTIEKLQFSVAALESDLLKQPVLTFATNLYEGKNRVNTAKRMLIINSFVRLIDAERIQHGKSIPKMLRAIGNIFNGFKINPEDSCVYKNGNISDYDKMSFVSNSIAKLFAIVSDIVHDEPEEENEVKSVAFETFLKVLDNNYEYCYPAFMYYARQIDSLFGATIRDVFIEHLNHNKDFKNVYYTDKLSKDNYKIFLKPPVISYTFYLSALKHVIASLKSDELFDVMTDEFKKHPNVNNPVFKCFYAAWFFLAATPKVVDITMKNINSKRPVFHDFVPDGSFPYYVKHLSQVSGISIASIFENLFILPILETPLPFGVAFWEVRNAENIAKSVTNEMMKYIKVVESLNVSYFSVPIYSLNDEVKKLHHFLDAKPSLIQDHEKFSRGDDIFLQLFNSNFFICNDIDIKRRKYWLLTTKCIPSTASVDDIIAFIMESLPHKQDSVILLDAEEFSSSVLDEFDTVIDKIDDRIDCIYLFRAGFGSSAQISNLYGSKFNILLDSTILTNVIIPNSMSIEEVGISGKMFDINDMNVYLYSDKIEFTGIENQIPVFASIEINDIDKSIAANDTLHIKTKTRDIRFSTSIASTFTKIIETWKFADQLSVMPKLDYSFNPLFELMSIAMISVSSTEADTASKAISLFYSALSVLDEHCQKPSFTHTYAGFSIPIKKFVDCLGEYKNDVISMIGFNAFFVQSSSTSSIIADTMNDSTVPRSVISELGRNIIRLYVSNQRSQASLKLYLLTQLKSETVTHVLVPLIAKYSEAKTFADMNFCLLKSNPNALFNALIQTLFKNEISGITFYQFVIKNSFYGILSNIYTKNQTLFDGRESTCLFISAIGLTLSTDENLNIFVKFFEQFLNHFNLNDILEKFADTPSDPKEYLKISDEAAMLSSDYEGYSNMFNIMAESGCHDAIILSHKLDELQYLGIIKRAFETGNPRRLIYALENVSNFIDKYSLMNVHPVFIIWPAFPLLLSNRADVKGAALDLIHSMFCFTKNVLKYPSILDVASSINQSDLLTNAMEQFYEALFDGFNDVVTDFEAYFGLALAASLVEPLINETIREKAIVIIDDALDSIPQPYYQAYFIILAVAFTDMSVESLVKRSGLEDATFSSIICLDADQRTPYEAIWITKVLFKGLITRQERGELFAQALIDFLKVRIEIQTITSTYILKVLTPMIEEHSITRERMLILSKVIAVATTALPYGDEHEEVKLDSPEPNKILEDDLAYHFREIVAGAEDSIKTAYRVE